MPREHKDKGNRTIDASLYIGAGATIAGLLLLRKPKTREAIREAAQGAFRGAIAAMRPRRALPKPSESGSPSDFVEKLERAKRRAAPIGEKARSVETIERAAPQGVNARGVETIARAAPSKKAARSVEKRARVAPSIAYAPRKCAHATLEPIACARSATPRANTCARSIVATTHDRTRAANVPRAALPHARTPCAPRAALGRARAPCALRGLRRAPRGLLACEWGIGAGCLA